MSTRDAAAQYIARGLSVVQLMPKTKAPNFKDWMKVEFTPDMFGPDDNIGLRSVNGLTDVDCDSVEVELAAPHLLPATRAVYGRASRSRSHYLYTSEFQNPVKLEDEKRGTLIEIRVNHQSMCPPSIHPNGEKVQWVGDFGEIPHVPAADLLRAVRLTATCAMIVRCYPGKGARHEWGLAMSGFLRQLDLSMDEALRLIEIAGEIAKDPDITDRTNAVRGTYSKPIDSAISGTGNLLKLVGKDIIQAFRDIWGIDPFASSRGLLEKFNETHAAIFLQSGQFTIITEDRDANGKHFLRFSSPEDIKQTYVTPIATAGARGVKYVKLGQAWLDWDKRRSYEGLELNPAVKGHGRYYNMWKGFTVEPKKAPWSLFRKHIREIICDGSEEIEHFVINWMARTVQEPGRPASSAIAFRGGQGTGKSTFAKWFGHVFGTHFLHLDSTRQLTGNFNSHLHNAILVFADEAAWPGDKAGVGALRRMVTEDTLTIERKGKDVITVPNLIHMLLASNEKWVVPAAFDERRFAVLDVSNKRRNDRDYFAAIQSELFEYGGLGGMLWDLLECETRFLQIPNTKALLEQKQITAEPKMQWWYEVIDSGGLWRDLAEDEELYVDRDAIYDMYVEAVEKGKLRYSVIGMKTQLGLFLSSVLPEGYPKGRKLRNGKRYWTLPSLKTCREFYAAKFNSQVDWSEEEDGDDLPF